VDGKRIFGPIRGGEKKKKFVFETKIFHKTRVRGVIEEEEVRV
jgi:hypothetical protein